MSRFHGRGGNVDDLFLISRTSKKGKIKQVHCSDLKIPL